MSRMLLDYPWSERVGNTISFTLKLADPVQSLSSFHLYSLNLGNYKCYRNEPYTVKFPVVLNDGGNYDSTSLFNLVTFSICMPLDLSNYKSDRYDSYAFE